MKTNFNGLIAFSILMQDHSGEILEKSPSYVMEKFSVSSLEKPELLLDEVNLDIYKQYLDKWCKERSFYVSNRN